MDKFIIAKEGRVGRMRLFSLIDSEGFTLEKFLSEFQALEGDDSIDEIEILINSGGGSVWQGFPIVTAISQSKKSVTTIIDTIGASMAGLIFLAGRKRKMFAHAQLMLHAARYEDGHIDDAITNTNNSFVEFIKNTTKRAKATIEGWLKKDTYFTAKQAVENKLAHEIIPTSIHASLVPVFQSNVRNMVAQGDHDINNLKSKFETFEMDEIISELKLTAEASQNDIKAAIQEIKNALAIKEQELVNREAKISELQAKVDVYVSKEKEEKEKAVNAIIEEAFLKRQISAEGKTIWKTLLTTDFENASKAIKALTITEKISDSISTDEKDKEPTIVLTPLQQMMKESY